MIGFHLFFTKKRHNLISRKRKFFFSLKLSLQKFLNEKFLYLKNYKLKKKLLKWFKKIKACVIFGIGSYLILRNPKSLTTPYIFLKHNVFLDYNAIKKILQKISNTNFEKKEDGHFSRKFLIIGGTLLTVTIGLVLFNKTNHWRLLYTPKLEELPLNPVAFTLENREFVKNQVLEEAIKLARQNVSQAVTKFGGKATLDDLLIGRFKFDFLTRQESFKFLTQLLNEYSNLHQIRNSLKGHENILNPTNLAKLEWMKDALKSGLEYSIIRNPKNLGVFAKYMKESFVKIQKGSNLNLTNDGIQKVVEKLLLDSLEQLMIESIQKYKKN